MANKKANKQKRRPAAKSRPVRRRAKKATPLGVTLGVIGTGANMILTPKIENHGSTASVLHWMTGEPAMPMGERISRSGVVLKKNLTDLNNYKPAVLGVAASASKKIPIVDMAAKPVDKMIRRVSKGKAEL